MKWQNFPNGLLSSRMRFHLYQSLFINKSIELSQSFSWRYVFQSLYLWSYWNSYMMMQCRDEIICIVIGACNWNWNCCTSHQYLLDTNNFILKFLWSIRIVKNVLDYNRVLVNATRWRRHMMITSWVQNGLQL